MSKPELRIVKPSTEAEKATHSTSDTWEVTPARVRAWKLPEFQRPLRINTRVMALVEDVKKTQIIPGTIVLGVMDGHHWLIDGQHRREAFLLSELMTAYCDVRILHVKSMGEMAREFANLNSRLVNMRPDDFLKAMEPSSAALQKIRKRCPFVGYDMVRRGDKSPIVSMSAIVRMWAASAKEVPQSPNGGAVQLAESLSIDEADMLIEFLDIAHSAFGRDPEFFRLWGALNLLMCMWLYRRIVHGYSMTAASRSVRVTPDQFRKCLMSLSADASYLDWLVGRMPSDRDRSPCLGKIKAIFSKRIEVDTGKQPKLPSPAWAHGASHHKA